MTEDKALIDWLEDQRKIRGLWITSSNGCFAESPLGFAVISCEDYDMYSEWTGPDIRSAFRSMQTEAGMLCEGLPAGPEGPHDAEIATLKARISELTEKIREQAERIAAMRPE